MAEKTEKWISDIIGALHDPLIVWPGGWGEDIPEDLKNAITLERLMMNMTALHGEDLTGTDAEACAYLMTVSLTQPLDSDWTQIYLYIASKTYTQWGKQEMPADIRVDSLNYEQMADLNRLKEWLYRQRTKARQESERIEKRAKEGKGDSQEKSGATSNV